MRDDELRALADLQMREIEIDLWGTPEQQAAMFEDMLLGWGWIKPAEVVADEAVVVGVAGGRVYRDGQEVRLT